MENERLTTRWQDCGSLAIGIWLLVSPLVMNYSPDNQVTWSGSTYIAVAIIGISIFAICLPNIWCEGLIFGIGVWMISKPLIGNLEVAAPDQRLHQVMMVDSVLTSVLLLIFSLLVIFEDGRLQNFFRKSD